MRYLYLAFLIIMTGIVLLFVLQNATSATVKLFSWSVTLPLSVIVLVAYVLGSLTGGFLIEFIRSIIQGATKKRASE